MNPHIQKTTIVLMSALAILEVALIAPVRFSRLPSVHADSDRVSREFAVDVSIDKRTVVLNHIRW